MTTTFAPVIAWHGDPDLKAKTVAALRVDHEQDRLIRGTYAQIHSRLVYRGCMVGCLVSAQLAVEAREAGDPLDSVALSNFAGSWHEETARRFGIPVALAHLWDEIFESLPAGDSVEFAIESIEAIEVGADLSLVPLRLVADMLGDKKRGVVANFDLHVGKSTAVAVVLALINRHLAGDVVEKREWSAARSLAAGAFSYIATYAAECLEYETFAGSVAGSFATEDRDWQWIAERLIHHTKAAPIPVAA